MKNFNLTVFTIIFWHTLFGQSIIKPGYIITTEQDTIYGQIKYREGAIRYNSCLFKKNHENSFSEYNPYGILGYGYNDGQSFVSNFVTDPENKEVRIFMEVLVNGRLRLLKWDGNLYVQKDNNEVILLENTYKVISVKNNRYSPYGKYAKYNYEYISVLNILLSDCPSVYPKLKNLKLIEAQLIKFLNKINKTCYPESYIAPGKSSKNVKFMNADIGLVAGYSYSSLRVSSLYGLSYQLVGQYEPSFSPVWGVQANLYSLRLSEKFKFHIEFILSSNTYRIDTERYPSPSRTLTSSVTIDVSRLAIPVGIRYRFPGKKFYPYVELAVLSVINYKKESNWNEKEIFSDGSIIVRKNNASAAVLNWKQFGVWTKAGMQYNVTDNLGLFTELQYDYTPKLIHMSNVFSKLNKLALRFGVMKTF